MLHLVSTMMFLAVGSLSLAIIAALLIDEAPAISHALGMRPFAPKLSPVRVARIRVVRSPRLTSMGDVRPRAVA